MAQILNNFSESLMGWPQAIYNDSKYYQESRKVSKFNRLKVPDILDIAVQMRIGCMRRFIIPFLPS